MAPNSCAPTLPPLLPAYSVSAAAWPMGNSSSSSSMKRRRSSPHATRPSNTPASAMRIICVSETSPAPSIQMPGMVKAKPPATMAPADMMVWVTFASFSERDFSARRKNSEIRAAKTIGQGRAPIFRAVYRDAAVITTQPMHPMMMLRRVSCPLVLSIFLFSFFPYIRFPFWEVGLRRVVYNRRIRLAA